MNEQELEDKIWDNTFSAIHKTGIWRKVGGDKKKCFDKIDQMVQTSQLKETDKGEKKIMYVRVDATKKLEFELGFTFQVSMLKLMRSTIGKLKKPMFRKIGSYKVARWNMALKSTVFDIDRLGEYKPRTKTVKTNFENMGFYYNALLLFISRANLQRSLGLITISEAEKRIEKCENALEYHFKKLLSENPRDSKAIRQYFKYQIYQIERFRIM